MGLGETFARVRLELVKDRPGDVADKTIDWLTYLIGLVPGVGAVGQIANKIINDGRLKKQFDQVAEQIETANVDIRNIDAGLQRVAAIASTAASRQDLQTAVADLLLTLQNEASEFVVDTRAQSRQDILNTIVEADRVLVSALQNSTNIIRNSQVKARRTELRAHDNSYNVVDGTSFSDGGDSVSMHGMTQSGHVEVTGNSVSFGEGGGITFGPPPDLLSGNCPFCRTLIQVRAPELRGYSQVQCHHCRRSFPFQLPK